MKLLKHGTDLLLVWPFYQISWSKVCPPLIYAISIIPMNSEAALRDHKVLNIGRKDALFCVRISWNYVSSYSKVLQRNINTGVNRLMNAKREMERDVALFFRS